MMKKFILFCGCFFACFSSPVLAWNGYDYTNNVDIEIGEGNLVRSGSTIEIYDYADDSYKDVEVESVYSTPGGVNVEVYDSDSDTYRTFEMED